MSIPLDRLYHYVESVAQNVYGDTVIYRFWPHGSKKIDDLQFIHKYSNYQKSVLPEIICYDQEPLNYSMYQHTQIRVNDTLKGYVGNIQDLVPGANLRTSFVNVYDKCVLLHSEKNSKEVAKYQADQFVPAYYWSHGLIALDWFRYARHYQPVKNITGKKFLIYNRSWSGTREYRIKFTDLLIDHDLLSQCQTWVNAVDPASGDHYQSHCYENPQWRPHNVLEHWLQPTQAQSCYSADFDTDDYDCCDIEIVLETLFDDSRLHLTEKSLRPIALGKPFVLAGTAGSLKYLKSYGFETFDTVFDESYDSIQDPQQRLEAIVTLMKKLSDLPPALYQEKLQQLQNIADRNKAHFFSQDFFDRITQELKINLGQALEQVESTNTSKRFVDLRKTYARQPGYASYCNNEIRAVGKEFALESLKKTLIRARFYYDQARNK